MAIAEFSKFAGILSAALSKHQKMSLHYRGLECKVKWALGSITMSKASASDGIPVELFQIPKDEAVKVLHLIASKFGKLHSGHRTGKGQFSFQSQRKAMPKNAQTVTQLHSSHTLAK